MKTVLLPIYLTLLSPTSQAQNWEPFENSGTYQTVYTFFYDATDQSLYIGGNFTWFSGLQARGIVRWDGQAFHTLGVLPNSIYGDVCQAVTSTIRYKGEIYCTMMNGPWEPGKIRGVARWDGVGWDSIPGIEGTVWDQLIFNDELYILGGFTMAENEAAGSVIRWDGENWQDLGFRSWLGYDADDYNPVLSGVVFDDELYVGGSFWTEEDQTTIDVARYDGENWHVVGGGIHGGFDDVRDLIVYQGELYTCGDFKKSAGNAGNMIMKLKNGQWTDVGGSFKSGAGAAYEMMIYHDKLYVVGNFDNEAGGVPMDNVAVWDGERWCGLGSDFNNGIGAVIEYEDDFIIGGGWEYIDSVLIPGIARWVGGDNLAECGEPVSGSTEPAPADHFSLSPNPAHSQIQLSAALPAGYLSPAVLSAHNLLGQLVWSQTLEPGNAEIQKTLDVGGWPPGVYVFSLEAGGRVWLERLIIVE